MHLNTFLAQAAAPTAATSTAATGTQPSQPNWLSFAPMILLVVVFYFVLLRPQSQQRKKQAALISALKAGDKVVTTSGIIGVVITVKDTSVSLRSADSKLEVAKSSVVQILESGAAAQS